MGFLRQEYWSGLPFPSPGDLPNLGMECASPASPTMKANSVSAEPSRKPIILGLSKEPITEWKSSSNPFLLSTLWLLFISDLAFFSNLGFWSVLFLSPLSVCPSIYPLIHWCIHLLIDSSVQVLPTTYLLCDGLCSVPQMTMLSSEGLGTPCGLFLHHACRGVQGAGRPPAWAPPWVAWLHCKPG